jgi:hypothetical protein
VNFFNNSSSCRMHHRHRDLQVRGSGREAACSRGTSLESDEHTLVLIA